MKKTEADLKWLVDPSVFEVNRLKAHSDHRYYQNVEEALNDKQMKLKQSLNGTWYFSFAKNPQERLADFYKEDTDCYHFETINVPGHIQMQGYDHMHYINNLYPWDGHEELKPPYISMKDNPVASYVRYFEIDEELKNKTTRLVFDGVETAFYVWLNGTFIGYSEDSFTPASFDITHALKDGVNKLAVEVFKFSSASWLEDQDFWRFSGIFRDVSLYAIEDMHINDLFVKTNLKNNYKDAEVKISLDIIGQKNGYLDIDLYDSNNNVIYQNKTNLVNDISFELNDVSLWSSESPTLYKLLLVLRDMDGNVIEAVPQNIGFREFKLDHGIMKLNGKRLVFRGINRHEFSADKGRAISEEEMLFDIKFMKRHNINAVRTSHYPNQSLWYELCDQYGIYLIDEANLESHGTWQKLGACEPSYNVPGNLIEWHDTVIDRANSMLQRDKNHPSVLIWSCGNESYAGTNIVDIANFFRKTDPARLVHYEGCVWNRDYSDATDMESRMYAKAFEIEEYLNSNPLKPYISCEYMHAMGNSLGGMEYYTRLEDKYEKYQGGFIWDYIDQAICYTNNYGEKVLGYGGDFKDRFTDSNFCGNGIVFANRDVSPKAQEVKYLYQDIIIEPNDDGAMITNKMMFSSTSKYKFVYSLKQGKTILQKGTFIADVKPGESKQIYFSWLIPSDGEFIKTVSAQLVEDKLWASKGFEVAFGQDVVGKYSSTKTTNKPLKIVEGVGNLGIKYDNFEALFAIGRGLISLKYNNQEYIASEPKPVFSRASTDNDRGCMHEVSSSMWFAASSFYQCTNYNYEISPDKTSVKIYFEYTLPVTPVTTVDVIFDIRSPGVIRVDFHYHGKKGLPELPLIGMNFKLYNDVDRFEYLGKGPQENYSDRKAGAKLDVYNCLVKDNLSPYLVPQECGNRCDLRYLAILDCKKQGICFKMVDSPFEANVLPYSMQTLESVMHQEELPKSYFTYVTISARQMGVGGDDSWGSLVHDEYRINAEEDITYSFEICKYE